MTVRVGGSQFALGMAAPRRLPEAGDGPRRTTAAAGLPFAEVAAQTGTRART